MAIQMRRGDYADFDPTKLVAGELAVVTSGDPNSDTGRALYICFEPGVVKRVTDYEDLIDQINAATQEIQQRFTASVKQSARDALSFAESASSSAGTASSASESATAASQSASSAQAAAESAAAAAKDAKEYVDQHGTKPMTGATTTATGTAGTVPAPQAGTSTRFLCSDATWKEAVDATQGKAINDAIAKNAADITALNISLGNKAESSDLTALQKAFGNSWYPSNLPSGFNSTDKHSMSTLKNGFYWHTENDGTLNFPSYYGFMVKFGFEADGYDFNALFFTQSSGTIYRISGNGQTISSWVAV